MVEQKSSFWLVLFTPDASSPVLPVVPATWSGVVDYARTAFPEAVEDLLGNLHVLKQRQFKDFEEEAGFSFWTARGTGLAREAGLLLLPTARHLISAMNISAPSPSRDWPGRSGRSCFARCGF